MRQRVLPGSGIRRSLSGCGSLRFLRGSLGIVRMRVVILRVSHASIVPAETCFAQPATRYATKDSYSSPWPFEITGKSWEDYIVRFLSMFLESPNL